MSETDSKLKLCSACRKALPFSSFNLARGKPDGRCSKCRDCSKAYAKAHYNGNTDYYKAKSVRSRRRYQMWYAEVKSRYACAHCGEDHPACLQFHHPNKDKDIAVSTLAMINRKRALAEIAKCIPLCANCHAKEHFRLKREVSE